MNKKTKQSISFLLVAVLIACCAVFFSCGDSNNPVVAPQETVYKLDYNNVTLTEYHKEKIAQIFKELLEENARFYTDRMASASKIFSLASAGFGDLTGTFGLVGDILGWCQPNYAKMDYKLEKQIQSEITQMQTQLNTISGQITTLTANVQTDFAALFGETAQIEQNTYTSSVENATQAVAELTSSIKNCADGSKSSLSSCLTTAMTNIDVAKMILDLSGAAINQDGSFNNSYSPPPKTSTSSEKQQYYKNISQNYNNITSNAISSSVYNDLDSFYTTIQVQADNDASKMSTIFDNYNQLIVSNYIRSVNALIQLLTDISYVSTVSGVTWNNNIPSPVPLPTGYTSTSTFYNLQNYGYFSLLTLASIYINSIISDVNIQDINCNNYTETNLSYPFQAPKYWPGLVPGGTWANTCDIYRWNGFLENYSGAWDSDTLTAECLPMTIMPNSNPSCAMFGSDPSEINFKFSTLCTNGLNENSQYNSGVNTQYLPTLNNFNYDSTNNQNPEPIIYAYCTSVNVSYWNNDTNPTTSAQQPDNIQPTTTCNDSNCSNCSFYLNFDTSSYSNSYWEPWQCNFPNGCCVTPGNYANTWGISADYDTICGDSEICGPFTWVIGINQNGSSDYTGSGAIALEGSVYVYSGAYLKDRESTLYPNWGCFNGDDLCRLSNSNATILCYGLDEIQMSSTGDAYEMALTVTPNGCWQYADKSNMTYPTQ
jgi:hypothetical protein